MKKTGKNFHEIGFGDDFMDMTSKARQQQKINCSTSELKNFVHERTLSKEWKDNPWSGKKYLLIIHLIKG